MAQLVKCHASIRTWVQAPRIHVRSQVCTYNHWGEGPEIEGSLKPWDSQLSCVQAQWRDLSWKIKVERGRQTSMTSARTCTPLHQQVHISYTRDTKKEKWNFKKSELIRAAFSSIPKWTHLKSQNCSVSKISVSKLELPQIKGWRGKVQLAGLCIFQPWWVSMHFDSPWGIQWVDSLNLL